MGLKQAFIRHYLGDADKTQIRRKIERAYQGEKELVTSFIPRILRLFKLVDPEKSEESLVDCVRDKLRAEYQEKLSMYTIYTLEELNDLCLKVEAGRAAARGSAPRRRNEGKQEEKEENASSNREKTTNNKQSSSKPNSQDSQKCYRCGRWNHLAANCYS